MIREKYIQELLGIFNKTTDPIVYRSMFHLKEIEAFKNLFQIQGFLNFNSHIHNESNLNELKHALITMSPWLQQTIQQGQTYLIQENVLKEGIRKCKKEILVIILKWGFACSISKKINKYYSIQIARDIEKQESNGFEYSFYIPSFFTLLIFSLCSDDKSVLIVNDLRLCLEWIFNAFEDLNLVLRVSNVSITKNCMEWIKVCL